MPKRLEIITEKCTECRTCSMKCSFVHFTVYNPNKGGIQITPNWPDLPRIHLCQQCADPACYPACPNEAMEITAEGVVKIIYENCIGCGLCVDACPYDGVWLDPLTGIAVKCDTCEGRFECVADCFAGALSIRDDQAGG
jgi:carbon-monoxide dehydrogenase iron sulfur subunit